MCNSSPAPGRGAGCAGYRSGRDTFRSGSADGSDSSFGPRDPSSAHENQNEPSSLSSGQHQDACTATLPARVHDLRRLRHIRNKSMMTSPARSFRRRRYPRAQASIHTRDASGDHRRWESIAHGNTRRRFDEEWRGAQRRKTGTSAPHQTCVRGTPLGRNGGATLTL